MNKCSKAKPKGSLSRCLGLHAELGPKVWPFSSLPPETVPPARLTKPHDERESAHHRRCCSLFCTWGSVTTIVNGSGFIHERHSARGRHALQSPRSAEASAVKKTRLKDHAIHHKQGPTKQEAYCLHSRQGRKIWL